MPHIQVTFIAGTLNSKKKGQDFPGGSVVKTLPAYAEYMGSIPGLGRSHRLQLLQPVHPRACALQQEKPPREKLKYRNWRAGPALHN